MTEAERRRKRGAEVERGSERGAGREKCIWAVVWGAGGRVEGREICIYRLQINPIRTINAANRKELIEKKNRTSRFYQRTRWVKRHVERAPSIICTNSTHNIRAKP